MPPYMSESVERAVSVAISDRDRQLKASLQLALTQLNNSIPADGDLTQLDLAFGDNWNRQLGLQLIQAWSQGDRLPEIEIVESSQINGGNGAFDRTNQKIYISQQLLAAQQPDLLTAVLLEELGHYFDSQVNQQDSTGDEGAIFA